MHKGGNVVRTSVGLSLALASVLVLGCSKQGKGSEAGDQRAAAKTPEEIEALFAREKDVPEARAAAAPDGSWSAEFPSSSEVKLTPGKGHVLAEFSLGTESTTRCVFYEDVIDAGQTIDIILEGIRKNATIDSVAPYRVIAAQGNPVVFLEARYLADTEGGKSVGGIKLAVSPRLTTPVFCSLDEPGYEETFVTAVTSVLNTLRVKEPGAEPTYAEISGSTLDGTPFGFEWLQLIDEGKGKYTTVSLSATFLPTGPGELSTNDDVEVCKNDAAGIVEGTYYEAEGREIAHDLTLTRSGKTKYAVSGKVQGKDFKSEFTAAKLPDDVATYRLLRQSHKKTTTIKSTEFSPTLDPSKPTEVSYAIDGKAHTVTIVVGQMSLLSTLTEEGLLSQVSAKMGEHEMKQEIIHRSGKF